MNYPLYNETLCPEVWDKTGETYTLKPEIRKNLVQIFKDFVADKSTDAEIKLKIQDVVLVGSITNYNWTPYSDVDMQVIVDYKTVDADEKKPAAFLDGLKSGWNKAHEIKINGLEYLFEPLKG